MPIRISLCVTHVVNHVVNKNSNDDSAATKGKTALSQFLLCVSSKKLISSSRYMTECGSYYLLANKRSRSI